MLQQRENQFFAQENIVDLWVKFDDSCAIKYTRFLVFEALAKLFGGGGRLQGMKCVQFVHTYDSIISIENLLLAWKEFEKGKKNKKDVQEFSLCLMDNIFSLHNDLKAQTYKHSGYHAFNISDPKPRNIHKATVRDRLVHHAIYRILYPFFDKIFITDSYSCRLKKGTHKAVERFAHFAGKVGRNNTKTVWVIKCDIRKFFANIDHDILKEILKWYIPDAKILSLLDGVIGRHERHTAV